MSGTIFTNVHYFVSMSVNLERKAQLVTVLDGEGAVAVSPSDSSLTHFITTTMPPPNDSLEAISPDSQTCFVTPEWVERSYILNSQQPTELYSSDPAHLFSGVVATATDLSQPDLELLSAAITALGGQWRSALTRDVTHLFALAPGSAKYETAMHFRPQTNMRIVTPHWFDDVIRIGDRTLSTTEYEWPDPIVFKNQLDAARGDRVEAPGAGNEVARRVAKMSPEKKSLYETILSRDKSLSGSRAPPRDLWKGLRILLSPSLQLTPGQREAHEVDIVREGGFIVKLDLEGRTTAKEIAEEETSKVDEADVYVTRYRAGPAYVKAYKLGKTIGSLTWLWYVRSRGSLSRPVDQLLHYPLPKKPIEGFSNHIITISNYTGKDRDYLKKLILALGAQFTPSMSGKNTVVLAAYCSGTKTDKALSWSIPVVNHTWLEDCFAQWRNLTTTNPKYSVFPPGVDYSGILTNRNLHRLGWTPEELDALEVLTDEDIQDVDVDRERKSASAPPGSASSAQDAEEVEDAVAPAEAEGDVSIGAVMDIDMVLSDVVSLKRKPGSKAGKSGQDKDVKREPVKRSRKPVVTSGDDLEQAAGSRSPAKATYKKEAPPSRRRTSDVNADVEQETAGKDAKTTKRLTRQKQIPKDTDMQLDEDAQPGPSVRNPRTPGAKVRKAKFADDVSDVEMGGLTSSDESVVVRKTKITRSIKRTEEDEPNRATSRTTIPASVEPITPSRTTVSPGKAPQTPHRQVSVVLPTAAEVYSPRAKRKLAKDTHVSPRSVGKAGSISDETADAPVRSPGKRRRPSTHKALDDTSPDSPVTPPRKSTAKGAAATSTAESLVAGPGGSAAPPFNITFTRTPSKRTAASKATQKLHDEIMPDVVNFQKEMKRKTVRAAWEEDSTISSARKGRAKGGSVDDDEVDAASKSKSKKRLSIVNAGDSSENERPGVKKRRTATQVAKEKPTTQATGSKRTARRLQDEDEDSSDNNSGEEEQPRRHKADNETHADVTSSSKISPKDIRIMTTQVTLGDDVIKVLTKMGAKITTKPTECTHLVSRNLVRTEKFLCAMATAAYIVTDKWATTSAAAKKFLPEEDYALRDPENEEKYGFKLTDALRRAKANGGKLFKGLTFYVTPKVPVDAKLLKNVVIGGGGQLLTQTPTTRILSGKENRYVISSPSDVSIWRPLAEQGYPVYSQELILTGALRQELEWDNNTYKVPGSF